MAATSTRSTHPADAGAATPVIPPFLVTVPQAARLLSIGRTAVYQLIWDGELTPIHIGRSVRLPISQIADFVSRRTGG